MKKQSQIQIVDARRSGTIKGGSRAFDVVITSKKKLPAYRVKSVGKNGEILAVSEVLNTPAAVIKNIAAMEDCWGHNGLTTIIRDYTQKQVFAKKRPSWKKDAPLPLRFTEPHVSGNPKTAKK